jgi:hypothetical protein
MALLLLLGVVFMFISEGGSHKLKRERGGARRGAGWWT